MFGLKTHSHERFYQEKLHLQKLAALNKHLLVGRSIKIHHLNNVVNTVAVFELISALHGVYMKNQQLCRAFCRRLTFIN